MDARELPTAKCNNVEPIFGVGSPANIKEDRQESYPLPRVPADRSH